MLCYFLFDYIWLIGCIFVMIGSILPDIDTPYSKLGRWNPAAYTDAMHHRGFTHTVLASIMFGLIAWYFLGAYAGVGISIGCIGHLFMDSLTPTGIMWAFPFNQKFYRIR